jgi:hypothetical protein
MKFPPSDRSLTRHASPSTHPQSQSFCHPSFCYPVPPLSRLTHHSGRITAPVGLERIRFGNTPQKRPSQACFCCALEEGNDNCSRRWKTIWALGNCAGVWAVVCTAGIQRRTVDFDDEQSSVFTFSGIPAFVIITTNGAWKKLLGNALRPRWDRTRREQGRLGAA